MYLCDGKIDNNYKVTDIELPTNIGTVSYTHLTLPTNSRV